MPICQSSVILIIMETKGPAAFKYKVEGSSNATLVVVLIVALFGSIVCAANFGAWLLLGLLLPVGIVIYLVRKGMRKSLLIASRYLIVGEQIIYYGTVAKAQLDRQRQVLTLISEKGKRLTIEAEKFPTNARKDFKIKANKTAKFDKVCEKVLTKLSGVTPEIIG
ncbi:MAG: hypothetical protein OEL57_06705 [Trichlorobacter sp.]|uniref:hypothetical protein n=1 Tax=Trichlorobacter sp. TaxID=2911007 RepID=UPI00256E3564|nr:hypothetical protein [Trichlorobacter sp.]MDK9717587.1 hypothetical protein [Trichlorobacter sp.]